MWQPDWFGRTDNFTVTEGRWAYIGVQGDQWANVAHNSYGLLRAPWNNNPRPWLTRSNSMCGITTTGMPSCMIHFQALNDTYSWFDFAWQLPYAPHGARHAPERRRRG